MTSKRNLEVLSTKIFEVARFQFQKKSIFGPKFSRPPSNKCNLRLFYVIRKMIYILVLAELGNRVCVWRGEYEILYSSGCKKQKLSKKWCSVPIWGRPEKTQKVNGSDAISFYSVDNIISRLKKSFYLVMFGYIASISSMDVHMHI